MCCIKHNTVFIFSFINQTYNLSCIPVHATNPMHWKKKPVQLVQFDDLNINNLFIMCIPISNYNISYSKHIVPTYLYVDESIGSELCNSALIPYVMNPWYLDVIVCDRKWVNIVFLFHSTVTTTWADYVNSRFYM